MKIRKLAAVLGVPSVALAVIGCSTGGGGSFPERASNLGGERGDEQTLTVGSSAARQRLIGDYWIARSSARVGDQFCVTGGKWPKWLCEETMRATAVGWDDEFLVIRIGLPSKEYLVIDVGSDAKFVVDKQSLSDWSEVSGVEMFTWEEAWNRGIEAGA